VLHNLHVRIDRQKTVGRAVQFGASDVFCAMQDLPLEIARVDRVEIDDPQSADARRREIEREWRSQPSGSHAQNPSLFESGLSI
jgi:hypothetical protein